MTPFNFFSLRGSQSTDHSVTGHSELELLWARLPLAQEVMRGKRRERRFLSIHKILFRWSLRYSNLFWLADIYLSRKLVSVPEETW